MNTPSISPAAVSFAAVTGLCLHTYSCLPCRASQGHARPVSPYREYIHLTQSNPGSASRYNYRYILYFVTQMCCNAMWHSLHSPVHRSPAMHLQRHTSLWGTEWTLSYNFSETSSIIRTLQSAMEAEKRVIIIILLLDSGYRHISPLHQPWCGLQRVPCQVSGP